MLQHFADLAAARYDRGYFTVDGSFRIANQCDQKKSPNVTKSCPKMILLEKWYILTTLQKLPKYVGDLGELIIAKGFKFFPKVQ